MAMVPGEEEVRGVLLADGWHFVQPGSFKVEVFAFVVPEIDVVGGTGFSFIDNGVAGISPYCTRIVGPMSSILAFDVTPAEATP